MEFDMSNFNTVVTFNFTIDHDEENVLEISDSTAGLVGILIRKLEEKLAEIKSQPPEIAFASFELNDTQEN
jgi:hypothetical protein